MKNLIAMLTFAFLFLAFTISVSAGGGNIQLYAFPLRPFDQTKTFVLQADIYTNQACNEFKPAFAFKDSVDGDSLTSYVLPKDGTYITRHYFTGPPENKWKELCTYYIEAKSGNESQRTVTVNVNVDGQMETRETLVSFGNDEISKQIQSFGRVNDYDNVPALDFIKETDLGNGERSVELQWQKISWASQYSIFAAEDRNDADSMGPSYILTTTENTNSTVTIPADKNMYLFAIACKAGDSCPDSKREGINYIHVPRLQNSGSTSVDTTTSTEVTPVVNPTVLVTQSVDEDKINKLNRKVANLESKLGESQQKQNMLEQRINDLIHFIKKLFPSFNKNK